MVTTIPTIGFNVETIEYGDISFTFWDVGERGDGGRGGHATRTLHLSGETAAGVATPPVPSTSHFHRRL